MPQQDNDIQWKNLKTLYQFGYEKGGGYEIRVGCWVVNGKEGKPVLERREWWENNQGTRMQGKQKGLNGSDLYRVFGMAGELSALMDFPLPKEFAGAVPAQQKEAVKNDAPNAPVPQGNSRF